MAIFRWAGKTMVLLGGMIGLLLVWFIPWVGTLHLGVLVYFPYDEHGQRFSRIAGPFTNVWQDEWVASEKIPNFCKAALVASEDTLFYQHPGIMLDQMLSTYQKVQKGKRVRSGGSTITQQLVKNAFLSRERSLLRKAREAVGAILLDLIMAKDEQISWYFNIVEFGPRVYGLNSAAKYYFKKPAEALSPAECGALVSILPSPKKWGKSLRDRRFTEFMSSRYGTVIYRAGIMGLASSKDSQSAKRHDPFGGAVRLPGYALRKQMEEQEAGRLSALELSNTLDDVLPSFDRAGDEREDGELADSTKERLESRPRAEDEAHAAEESRAESADPGPSGSPSGEFQSNSLNSREAPSSVGRDSGGASKDEAANAAAKMDSDPSAVSNLDKSPRNSPGDE